MSDCPMLISNKLHSFRNFLIQSYEKKQCVVSIAWTADTFKSMFAHEIDDFTDFCLFDTRLLSCV